MSKVIKKRVSKKLKTSWRKHSNIDDVEDFLEDQRLEERLGPIATLTNDELFTVDTKPADETSASKKSRILKPLKCYQILEPFTKVPDPITKRNRVRTKEERKHPILKKREERDRLNGIVNKKELRAIQDRNFTLSEKEKRPKRGEFNKDLWGDDKDGDKNTDGIDNQWISDETRKHHLRGVSKISKTILKPKKGGPLNAFKAIEAPHPGSSYNPSYYDHQSLLKMIAEKEEKIIKDEKHLERVTSLMFTKVTQKQKDDAYLNEMSQGLNQEIVKEEESDGDYKAINLPVLNKKKTLQQRRKQKEQRELALKRKSDQLEKKKVTDLHEIKVLKKNISGMEERQKEQIEKRKKSKLLKAQLPKRLAAMKFEESDPDFNLGKDITGNLRNMKKEGNLLADRFNSLQKRSIIEPSIRRTRTKPKVKKFVRPGHGNDYKKTVARIKAT